MPPIHFENGEEMKSNLCLKILMLFVLVITPIYMTGCNETIDEYARLLDGGGIDAVESVIQAYNKNGLSPEECNRLALLYVKAARERNIHVKYIVAIGFVESEYTSGASYLGNYGLQQINWTAHKKRLYQMYGITDPKQIQWNDELNIDYSAFLISEMCSDPSGQNCNLSSLVRKYNGKHNPAYARKMIPKMNQLAHIEVPYSTKAAVTKESPKKSRKTRVAVNVGAKAPKVKGKARGPVSSEYPAYPVGKANYKF